MSGRTVYLILDLSVGEAIFASADEVACRRLHGQLRAALCHRGYVLDAIDMDDDALVVAALEEVAKA